MSEKTFFGNEINFNKPPIMWAGMEVYPGNGAASNLYGTLNVVKNPNEPTIPNINTDGNLSVKLNIKGSKNLRIDKKSTFNHDVKMNKKLILAKCGDVAKRIDRADKLPSSDVRLKSNIKQIENALDKVMQLNGVEYDFIDETYCGYLGVHQVGLIAQDVEKVIPEVVGENLDGYKAISYQHLISVLIEAVKEQQQQIENLKKMIEEK
jgi:hypothetical protein